MFGPHFRRVHGLGAVRYRRPRPCCPRRFPPIMHASSVLHHFTPPLSRPSCLPFALSSSHFSPSPFAHPTDVVQLLLRLSPSYHIAISHPPSILLFFPVPATLSSVTLARGRTPPPLSSRAPHPPLSHSAAPAPTSGVVSFGRSSSLPPTTSLSHPTSRSPHHIDSSPSLLALARASHSSISSLILPRLRLHPPRPPLPVSRPRPCPALPFDSSALSSIALLQLPLSLFLFLASSVLAPPSYPLPSLSPPDLCLIALRPRISSLRLLSIPALVSLPSSILDHLPPPTLPSSALPPPHSRPPHPPFSSIALLPVPRLYALPPALVPLLDLLDSPSSLPPSLAHPSTLPSSSTGASFARPSQPVPPLYPRPHRPPSRHPLPFLVPSAPPRPTLLCPCPFLVLLPFPASPSLPPTLSSPPLPRADTDSPQTAPFSFVRRGGPWALRSGTTPPPLVPRLQRARRRGPPCVTSSAQVDVHRLAGDVARGDALQAL